MYHTQLKRIVLRVVGIDKHMSQNIVSHALYECVVDLKKGRN